MDNAKYARGVFRTLSFKPAKAGVRAIARKRVTLDLAHAITGIACEVGEVHQALNPFLKGLQLNDQLKNAARPEFGDLLYFLTVACKRAKVKIPSSTKKLRLKGTTLTEALLGLHDISTELLSAHKKAYYDKALDLEKVGPLLIQFIAILWPLIYELYGVAPSVLMDENGEKLAIRYPDGIFDAKAALVQADKQESL